MSVEEEIHVSVQELLVFITSPSSKGSGDFCKTHQGLRVEFLLLWYSVLFTVESLSLFIFFLYLDLYVRCDKLGVFHANQTSMYLDPHMN